MTICFLLTSNDNLLSAEYNAEHVEKAGSNIRNYYKVDGAQSKRGGAKNCDNFLTGGRAVLVQKKANVRSCVQIRKNDDNRYVEFKIAQKAINKAMMAKKDCSVARKQTNLLWIQ